MTRKQRKTTLVAVDLFAGAGGFSEGFRQAGIHVKAACDAWETARLTYQRNHPETNLSQLPQNVFDLHPEHIRSAVPDMDILFGSPPCTEFSPAKNGGKGDTEEGLKAIFAFFRLVHYLAPRFWILENVPRLHQFLKKHLIGDQPPYTLPLREIGIEEDGVLNIPVYQVMNAQWFGVPQRRDRLFMGDFPLPAEVADETVRPVVRTVNDVLLALPDPARPLIPNERITDPLYPKIHIRAKILTSHFGTDTELDAEEVYHIELLKRDHAYYGSMDFPDRIDAPSRTVLARQHRIAREAIYVNANHRQGGISRLTPREIACLMGFPITYQFGGNSESIRYRQIGNAVCPPVAAAIGRAIMRAENIKIPAFQYDVPELFPEPKIRTMRHTSSSVVMKDTRRFRMHPRGLKIGTRRVDIENAFDQAIPHPLAGGRYAHIASWKSVLHCGIGGDYKKASFTWRQALCELLELTYDNETLRTASEGFLAELSEIVPCIAPDATSLQARWSRKISTNDARPELLLDHLSRIVHYWYPIDGIGKTSRFTKTIELSGERKLIPIAVIACLVACAFACDCANQGIQWIERHPNEFYWPFDDERPEVRSMDLSQSIERFRDSFCDEVARINDEIARKAEELIVADEHMLQPILAI